MSKHPGLITKTCTKYEFTGSYKGCEIQLNKEPIDDDWYILVWGKDGGLIYDGWWNDSSNASVDEAIDEAFDGAQL